MNRKLHATLALIAVVSFGLYILGCVGYAAWNADGTKLLVPYYSPQAREWGVALYDMKTSSITKVMAQANVGREDMFMEAQWVNAGRQPLVVIMRESSDNKANHVDAYLLPSRPSEPIRSWLLPDPGSDGYPVPPFPELDGKVFVISKQLSILNLKEGSIEVKPNEAKDEAVAFVAGNAGRLYYLRGLERPKSPTADSPNTAENGIQIGELTLPDLKQIRYFDVWKDELNARGLDLDSVNFVLEHGGTRFAMIAKKGDERGIMILNSTGIERVFIPQFPVQGCRVGDIDWVRSDLMYAGVACPVGEGIARFAIAEIFVNDGTVRLTPIVRVNADTEFYDNLGLWLKISLAPNGRTLATTMTTLEDKYVTRDNRALFLVDMKSPDRHVTKIPIPALTKAAVAKR